MNQIKQKILLFLLLSSSALIFISCKTIPLSEEEERKNLKEAYSFIIPKPVSVSTTDSIFILDKTTGIYVRPMSSETGFIANYLSEKLSSLTGYYLPVSEANEIPANRNIFLTVNKTNENIGEEGYVLTINEKQINIAANTEAGLFRGIQTLRQLFTFSTEISDGEQEILRIGTGIIKDYPRFEWRSVMLDVSRHFFNTEDVKRYIDLVSLYKINYFHLHLSDDQGWRIEINSWPNLTVIGGSTEVDGGSGGYYTQSEYMDIVEYADERYITVVPEIEMPGHTNAALASYPELNRDGTAPLLYTGIEVGFSALALDKDITYKFISDVIKEIAAITPGPYIHIGGDEAPLIDSLDYVRFIDSVQSIVNANGKKVIGWDEISKANLSAGTVVQHWDNEIVLNAVKQGAGVIMSPSFKTYMDMKYNPSTVPGLFWAGYIEVYDAYNWDPASIMDGISERNIIGIEAPLWTETLDDFEEIEYMVFPRLAGYSEIGWSPFGSRDWDDYKRRLTEHGLLWENMGINFYRSPQVYWK